MKKFRFHGGMAVGLALAVIAFGCARTRQTRSVETTGFLGDYSQLRKGEGAEAQLVYVKPGLNLAGYKKIIIDPIVIMRKSDSDIAELPKEQAQALADHLYADVLDALKPDYQITNPPGPGVLRLRIAITEARGSKVAMDAITTIIPQTKVLTTVGGLATDTSFFVGKAGVEAELLDSLSGERLMAAVDERVGTKALRGSFKTWDDVEQAYRYWAGRLKERLAELRSAK